MPWLLPVEKYQALPTDHGCTDSTCPARGTDGLFIQEHRPASSYFYERAYTFPEPVVRRARVRIISNLVIYYVIRGVEGRDNHGSTYGVAKAC